MCVHCVAAALVGLSVHGAHGEHSRSRPVEGSVEVFVLLAQQGHEVLGVVWIVGIGVVVDFAEVVAGGV